MCMITTAVRLGDEASKGNTSAASGAMRDSSRGNSYSSTANDSEESTRSPSHLPTPQVEGLAQNGVPAEKRRSTVVSSFLSGVSPPKKQRIQVIVRIRPIDDTACRYHNTPPCDPGLWKKHLTRETITEICMSDTFVCASASAPYYLRATTCSSMCWYQWVV